MKLRKYTRLDNAALMYTSTLSDEYATKFRVSVTLDHNIDKDILTESLAYVIRRFPSFRFRLTKGMFWWYFKTISQKPRVYGSCSLDPLPINDKHGYLFKVSVDGMTINLDVFHSLADGSASMTFLLTLASEYLHRVYGIKPDINNWVLNPAEEAREEEVADAFDAFSNGKGALEKGMPAYHVKGHVEESTVLHNFRVSVRTEDLVKLAKERNCTVTDLLSALMIRSIQQIRKEDERSSKKGVIKICVPVNLRKIFGKKSLRNFSSYVNLGVDTTNKEYSLDEIISEISTQKQTLLTPDSLAEKINANVNLENNFWIRMIPRPIKKFAIHFISSIKGDRLFSQTLSNLGLVNLPAPMTEHVKGMNFQLGRHLQNFGACGCISYGGRTNLNFSRKIRESNFERYFVIELMSLGINMA